MVPRLNIVTLGVSDFDKALRFYRDGLGFPLSPQSQGDIAFFQAGGVVLALYPYSEMPAEHPYFVRKADGYGGIGLAHNCESKEEVDAVLKQAEATGAQMLKPAQEVFWGGYSGYFLDPDGHAWEVAYNPFFTFDHNRNLKIG